MSIEIKYWRSNKTRFLLLPSIIPSFKEITLLIVSMSSLPPSVLEKLLKNQLETEEERILILQLNL